MICSFASEFLSFCLETEVTPVVSETNNLGTSNVENEPSLRSDSIQRSKNKRYLNIATAILFHQVFEPYTVQHQTFFAVKESRMSPIWRRSDLIRARQTNLMA
jgi:hypothetical protein